VDGKAYGIPEFYSARVLMINNQAAKEAGLNRSDVDTSDWSKLAGLAEQLTVTEGGKLKRIGFDPKIPESCPCGSGPTATPCSATTARPPNSTTPRWSRP
jgi:multiple sugar transport system substrate-binding protein